MQLQGVEEYVVGNPPAAVGTRMLTDTAISGTALHLSCHCFLL